MTGPRMGAATMPMPQKPIALPRSSGGNASSSTACDSGCITPPLSPCRMRKTIMKPSEGARPHISDAVVKLVTEKSSNLLRPKKFASQPVIGRMIALAAR